MTSAKVMGGFRKWVWVLSSGSLELRRKGIEPIKIVFS